MQPLQGSFVALVTPMNADGRLDFNALGDLIEWHIESGTNGIVAVGTTGESATVSIPEHIKIIEKTISFTAGRVPVIAGTGANSTQEAIDLTQNAASIGADYTLIVTPYYNKPNQEGLFQHFSKIADSVDIPQILYNVPSRTACDLKPDTVRRLSNHPNIIGIKEAVDDEERLAELISISQGMDQKHFSIFSGDDPTFNHFMSIGGDGVISVTANVAPKLISQLHNFWQENKFEEALNINKKLFNLNRILFVESNPSPVKFAAFKMGICKEEIRLPLTKVSAKYQRLIIEQIEELSGVEINSF